MAVPVTVVWLVAVTNAFNMIDGLDGLAAGVGAMVTATLFLLSFYLGNVGGGSDSRPARRSLAWVPPVQFFSRAYFPG